MGVRPVLTVRMTKDARRLIEITVDPVTNARADPLSRDLGAARVGGIPMRECAGHVDKAHSSELIGVFTLAPQRPDRSNRLDALQIVAVDGKTLRGSATPTDLALHQRADLTTFPLPGSVRPTP